MPEPTAETPAPAPAAVPDPQLPTAAEPAPGGPAAGDDTAPTAPAVGASAPPDAAPAAASAPAPSPALPDLSPAACAALLAQHFPALFGAGRALPIKLRIQADIQARVPGVFGRKALSGFLHRHTTSTAYLKALVAAPGRYDLDGVVAGEVAGEHRDAATAELERRRALGLARRRAEHDARRRPGPAGRQGQAHAPDDATTGAGRPDHRRPDRPSGTAAAAAVAAPVRPPPPAPPPAPPPPGRSAAEIEARRDRAGLLRAWESSTLTRANFCVLKRIGEAELEAQLAQARLERDLRPPEPRPDPRAGRVQAQRTHDGAAPRRSQGDGDPRPRPPQGRPPDKPAR